MTSQGSPSTLQNPASSSSDAERLAALERRLQETERALRQSNAKLRLALELGRFGLWERDLASGQIEANATCKAHLGLAPDEPLTVERLRRLQHPADVERIEQAIAYALATRTDYHVEHRVLRPDGRIGRILVKGCAFYEGDTPVRLAGTTQDLTERERIREEAQQAQRRQEFLLTLNDQLRSFQDPFDIMETTSKSLGRLLKADSVGYGEYDKARDVVMVEREWSRGVVSNEGRSFAFRDLPLWAVEDLERGRTLAIADVATDPRLGDPAHRAVYAMLNVRSSITVPLLNQGQLRALLYINASEPRPWSDEDVSLIEDVAKRTWIAIEKARAEIGLRETQARFEIIAESLPALVWILRPDLNLTYTNERWVTYSGLPPENALGHSWMNAIHPDDLAKILEDVPGLIRTQENYETEARYRSTNGVYRWHLIRAAPLHNAKGEFTGWVGTSVDIHDLKETEKALRMSEERLSLAQRAAGIGVFDWDISAGKVTWTPEQESLFGIEPGTFRGEFADWEEKVLPEDLGPVNKTIQEALGRGDGEINVVYRIRRPDGSIHDIDTTALLFYDAEGKPLRMIGVNIDVTRYKQAEQRQQLLIRELHHRVKNTLATVQAIVGSTARSAASIEEFYQGFVGRIVSLARTHNILTEHYWQGVPRGADPDGARSLRGRGAQPHHPERAADRAALRSRGSHRHGGPRADDQRRQARRPVHLRRARGRHLDRRGQGRQADALVHLDRARRTARHRPEPPGLRHAPSAAGAHRPAQRAGRDGLR
ncbi:PAS domain-containing protein [Microvirga thermotolerans]|uniref:Blue-light-activated histidine kinase n=1 Tax=Microvirga thermotolerans TaxID=2651334 RepID=A0A5P9JWC3_9HYPH|nr:PAS domain-containing protein [Microvirga thermotolerans]QFU17112.1 PAS domain-containing protein [Microvirga thermotolerans]